MELHHLIDVGLTLDEIIEFNAPLGVNFNIIYDIAIIAEISVPDIITAALPGIFSDDIILAAFAAAIKAREN
jgi:hypothetical protein